MRLVTYEAAGSWRPGVLLDEQVIDVGAAARAAGLGAAPTSDWASNRQIIQLDTAQRHALEAAARNLAAAGDATRALASVRLGPPIPDPDKIICLGLNYREHATEASLEVPKAPILFAKFRNSLTGPNSPIVLPRVSQQIDYEAELAVVIGRRCKEVAADAALAYVAGAMAFNDVSARDVQMLTSQWTAGKALDTFAPCGPALVLMDEIADIQALELVARVNGQTVQHASTAMMIFSVAETIAYISSLMTLEPGDIIATGTPAGVGFKRTPPLFLRDGDLVEIEIGGIGTLRNPVVGPERR